MGGARLGEPNPEGRDSDPYGMVMLGEWKTSWGQKRMPMNIRNRAARSTLRVTSGRTLTESPEWGIASFFNALQNCFDIPLVTAG